MILRLNVTSLTQHAAADLNNLESCAHIRSLEFRMHINHKMTAVQKSEYDIVTRATDKFILRFSVQCRSSVTLAIHSNGSNGSCPLMEEHPLTEEVKFRY